MKTTPEMISVMQAYTQGVKIEFNVGNSEWEDVAKPSWNWDDCDYRVKKSTKKVKLLAWFNGDSLFWTTQVGNGCSSWKRVPSEDKEIEVGE